MAKENSSRRKNSSLAAAAAVVVGFMISCFGYSNITFPCKHSLREKKKRSYIFQTFQIQINGQNAAASKQNIYNIQYTYVHIACVKWFYFFFHFQELSVGYWKGNLETLRDHTHTHFDRRSISESIVEMNWWQCAKTLLIDFTAVRTDRYTIIPLHFPLIFFWGSPSSFPFHIIRMRFELLLSQTNCISDKIR